MVYHVRDQSEYQMTSILKHLYLDYSSCVRVDACGPSLHLWQCAAHPYPAMAYWIGASPENCVAYLALFSTKLGELYVRECKRVWTDPRYRKRGFCTALNLAAAQQAPIMADSGGMTVAGYRLCLSMPGFTRKWWSPGDSAFVSEDEITDAWRFVRCRFQGNRYQLVLFLSGEVHPSADA